MQICEVRGTHYEIGFKMGEIFKRTNRGIIESNDDGKFFALKVKDKVEGIIPELIQEIHGFADGGKYKFEDILTFALTLGKKPNCTVFAISGEHSKNRQTIFARNYDGPKYFQDFDLYKTYPKGFYAHQGCTYGMIIGREDGINEKGLAIAVTGVFGKYTNKAGVWDHIAVRAVLDRCKNVQEALKLLKEIPHLYAKNFLLADKRNQIAIVEADQHNFEITYPEEGFGVITNHFTSSNMKRFNDEKKSMYRTHERHKNISRWYEEKKKPIDISDVISILNDSEKGVLSNHTDEDVDKTFLTVWSWIAQIGEREFKITTGTPITGDYKIIRF